MTQANKDKISYINMTLFDRLFCIVHSGFTKVSQSSFLHAIDARQVLTIGYGTHCFVDFS
jgi:hypothetical protein